ncbi:MAG TPA: ABC transporter permease [Acidimicrobiales bacterium]|nr:ABC transporter permease [Acidimicrobiales bacterium]
MTTTTAPPSEVPIEGEPPGPAPARPDNLLRSPIMVIGLVLIGLLVAMALLAPLVASHHPRVISGRALEEPSGRHWLGTDVPGRDIFAQLLYGARTSLVVALLAPALALLGAILIGVLPALVGGAADLVSNRLVVFLLALPGLPLSVLIAALAGNTDVALILVVAFAGVAPTARILRSQVLALRQSGFIAAARGFGGGPFYVLRRHVLPPLGPILVVAFVYWASVSIGLHAGLAFLGLGDPSGVSWGHMLNRALAQPSIYFSPMWTWWVLPPGIAITLALLGFSFVGVAMEPTFNPRWLRSS